MISKTMSQLLTGLVRSIRYANTEKTASFYRGYAMGFANAKFVMDELMHERLEALIHNAHDYRRMELGERELPRMMRKRAA